MTKHLIILVALLLSACSQQRDVSPPVYFTVTASSKCYAKVTLIAKDGLLTTDVREHVRIGCKDESGKSTIPEGDGEYRNPLEPTE